MCYLVILFIDGTIRELTSIVAYTNDMVQMDILGPFYLSNSSSKDMTITCLDCSRSPDECIQGESTTGCPQCLLTECCCWPVIHYNKNHS